MTRPLQLSSGQLCLNAKCDFGEITVAALDAEGNVVARSEPIQADALAIPVRWQEGRLPGKQTPVSLRIELKNALLYALWCQ